MLTSVVTAKYTLGQNLETARPIQESVERSVPLDLIYRSYTRIFEYRKIFSILWSRGVQSTEGE